MADHAPACAPDLTSEAILLMHELFATQAILDKALQKAAEEDAARITDLHLVVGEISSYRDDSVQFYWDELSKGTIAEGAQLHFRHVAAELQCMACSARYHPVEGEILCPSCGSSGARILSGEEFYMESLDVD
jgi:hydrogenase nickel incorporation protein HypA/HybF